MSASHGMLRSSLALMMISVAGYVVSFLNQLCIARLFGASAVMDAYLIAISVPSLFLTATGGLFSYYLVPILVRQQTQPHRISGALVRPIIAATVIVPSLAWVATPVIIDALMPTYSDEFLRDAISMSRLMWIVCGLTIMTYFLTALQHANKRFVGPGLASIVPYIGMVVVAVWLGPRIGPRALVWGMLAGVAVGMPVLLVGIGHELKPTAGAAYGSALVNILRPVPLVFLSIAGLAVYGTIDAVWISRLGPEHLSHFGYAQRLLIAIGNAVLAGPAAVLVPYLAEVSVRGEPAVFRRQLLQALRLLLFCLTVVCMIIGGLALPFIRLLFERGHFDRAATLGVSSLMPGMAAGVALMVTVILLFRAMYASGDVRGAVGISLVGALVYYGASAVGSSRYGVNGVVVAYGLAWFVQLCLGMLRLWKQQRGELVAKANLFFVGQVAAITGLGLGAVRLGKVLLVDPAIDSTPIDLGFRILMVSAIGAGIFMATANWGFRMREPAMLISMLPGVRNKKIVTPV